MSNKFEDFATTNNDYDTLPVVRKDSIVNQWEKKSKTSFSIKKSNIDKLDELVNVRGAKSRSMVIDDLIEEAYKKVSN